MLMYLYAAEKQGYRQRGYTIKSMNAQQLLTLAISTSTILGVFIAIIRWLVLHYFDQIKAELKPNGGGSMRDQVTRLESNQKTMGEDIKKNQESARVDYKELEKKVDRMTDLLIGYITRPTE
jgi:hypothetical protein